MLMPHVPR
nr:unnamed protein product [Callosobruchus analis]CAI5868675.1 unnamed protein product [Callosobruchus analis]